MDNENVVHRHYGTLLNGKENGNKGICMEMDKTRHNDTEGGDIDPERQT